MDARLYVEQLHEGPTKLSVGNLYLGRLPVPSNARAVQKQFPSRTWSALATTSNESTGRLLGGLAIGISSPETVPRVCATFPHRFDWVVKRLKKIIPLKNPHTHY